MGDGRTSVGATVGSPGRGVTVTSRGPGVNVSSAGGGCVGGMGAAGCGGAVGCGAAVARTAVAFVIAFVPFGVLPARKTSLTTCGHPGPGASPVVAQTSANSMPSGTSNFSTGLPSRAAVMNAFQIGAAVLVLVAPGIGRLSALPTHTPTTS